MDDNNNNIAFFPKQVGVGLKGVMDMDKKNPICTSGSGGRPCLQHHWRWHMRLRAIRDHDQGRA
jgi:hypothetical protein